MSFFEKAKKSMEGTRQDGCEKSELSEKRILPQEMPLNEFKKAGLIMKVYSEALQDHVFFISNEEAITRHKLDLVAYSATELTKMLSMTPEEVRAVHEVKKVFGKARVIEHRRVAA